MQIELIFDESVDGRIVRKLSETYPNNISIAKSYPGLLDAEIIELVNKHKAILITEDKDFGEWVFSHGKAIPGVIFLRYHFTELSVIMQALNGLLGKGEEKLKSQFIVISPSRIRYRTLN